MYRHVKAKSDFSKNIAQKILDAIELFDNDNEKIVASNIANFALGSPMIDDEYSLYNLAVSKITDDNKLYYITKTVTEFVRSD